ncbi:(d)CMP kinase [Alicyclobacillus sp. SO9]|uniref:(d)CMP kinase n=1 Tax=Alicyclobacillus sp. SO9 TaxID=2665646 RepID=UPI0018E757D1|nr:(d)CMP kinase [Alicyclobacillus sp. SO9]QQE76830.1 (d)CMP kinase [Alicyclobacillus sp. SO9]
MHHMTIAIDGPAGSGKSTVAQELAERLGLLYLDTGAMYRAVAWLALQRGVSPQDSSSIVQLMRKSPIHLERTEQGNVEIWVGSNNVTRELRTPEVSNAVSAVSAHPDVRSELTTLQRELSSQHPVVMDGRDIGTVVLPHATVKVFLTASLEERAKRRRREFIESGFSSATEQVAAELAKRDEQDSSRTVAPLKPAQDAHRIDSTGKSVDEVVLEIMTIVEQTLSWRQ